MKLAAFGAPGQDGVQLSLTKNSTWRIVQVVAADFASVQTTELISAASKTRDTR
jgi:alkyl hydroperoxide reductase subunit AhpC